jgi:hypothetical protein
MTYRIIARSRSNTAGLVDTVCGVAFCPRQEGTGNQRDAHGHLDHEIHICLEARTSPETRSQNPSEILDDG